MLVAAGNVRAVACVRGVPGLLGRILVGRVLLGHYLFGLLEEHGFSLQVFFGMQGPAAGALSDVPLIRTYAQNDTTHVAAMHNIFEMYLGINFELFCSTELNSLDMVQAARIYPNVYPGGMWWFNFRRSVYEKNMQYRVEALPATRATSSLPTRAASSGPTSRYC